MSIAYASREEVRAADDSELLLVLPKKPAKKSDRQLIGINR